MTLLHDKRDEDFQHEQNVRFTKRRIIVLVVSYLVLGCATRWLANLAFEHDWYFRGWIIVQAVVCALLLLLGLWLILQTNAFALRVVACFAGIIYSAGIISNGSLGKFLSVTTLMCIFFPLCAIAGHLVIHKYWKVEVKKLGEIEAGRREAFQFSILHLLGLTVVVGCLLYIANAMRAYQPAAGNFFQWGMLSITHTSVLSVVAMSITFFVIAISALWAILSLASPWLRMILVFAMTPCLGMLYPYVRQEDSTELTTWAASSLLTTALVTVALLVVRSCGTRLVRPC